MKYDKLRFTRKQADRILAEAAEREDRDNAGGIGEEITYSQLVEIAKDSTIDPKYLQVSTKHLVEEAGGVERAAIGRMFKQTGEFIRGGLEGFFTLPTIALSEGKKSNHEITAALLGVLGQIVHCGYAFAAKFTDGIDYNLPKSFFYTYVATNVASGVYEWYRNNKKDLIEEKIIPE